MNFSLQRVLIWSTVIALLAGPVWAGVVRHQSPKADTLQQALSHNIKVGQRKRTYHLYVPSTIQANQPLPIMLVLHGAYGTGKKIMHYTQMNAFAEKKGFIAVYPDKDGMFDWDLASGTQSRDIAFIRTLLAELKRSYPVDPKRIYATGYSSGGELAEILACTMANELAAVAPVASNMRHRYAFNCQTNKPVPVLMINGTSDPIDPWNGHGKDLMSVPDSIAFWEKHNNCEPGNTQMVNQLPLTLDDLTRVYISENNQCFQQATVMLVKIDHGGHTWPGTYMRPSAPPPPFGFILGRTSHNIDANEFIWNFFQQHPS